MERRMFTKDEKEQLVGELQQWRDGGGTTMDFSRQRGITRKSLNEWKRVFTGKGPYGAREQSQGTDLAITPVGSGGVEQVFDTHRTDAGPRMQAGAGAPVLVSVGEVTVAVFDETPESCVSRVLTLLGVKHVL